MRSPWSYPACRWLLIPVVALHNVEEWLAVPHYGSIAPTLQSYAGRAVTPPSFPVLEIAWVLVTLVPALIVVAAAAARRSRRWDWLVCGIAAIYLANAIVPHLLEFALSRTYAPGVLTAVFVNLPFALLLLSRAVTEGYVPRRHLLGIVTAGFLAQPVVLALVFAIAVRVAPV